MEPAQGELLTSDGCPSISVEIGIDLVKEVERSRVTFLDGKHYPQTVSSIATVTLLHIPRVKATKLF